MLIVRTPALHVGWLPVRCSGRSALQASEQVSPCASEKTSTPFTVEVTQFEPPGPREFVGMGMPTHGIGTHTGASITLAEQESSGLDKV